MRAFARLAPLDMAPHVYATTERAYRKACAGGGSQSLIVSGESGAGKTESIKVALAHLVWRSRSRSSPRRGVVGTSGGSQLTERLLQANPLLEALGNATTARNTNSSRFGKCVRVAVDETSGALVGGKVIPCFTPSSPQPRPC